MSHHSLFHRPLEPKHPNILTIIGGAALVAAVVVVALSAKDIARYIRISRM